MPQPGDGDLWPTTDDDKPRDEPSKPSTPVNDAVTRSSPVPEPKPKPAAVGWFDPPTADESLSERDKSHPKPAQQRTQPVSWPVADLEKQAKTPGAEPTVFLRPLPDALPPAPKSTQSSEGAESPTTEPTSPPAPKPNKPSSTTDAKSTTADGPPTAATEPSAAVELRAAAQPRAAAEPSAEPRAAAEPPAAAEPSAAADEPPAIADGTPAAAEETPAIAEEGDTPAGGATVDQTPAGTPTVAENNPSTTVEPTDAPKPDGDASPDGEAADQAPQENDSSTPGESKGGEAASPDPNNVTDSAEPAQPKPDHPAASEGSPADPKDEPEATTLADGEQDPDEDPPPDSADAHGDGAKTTQLPIASTARDENSAQPESAETSPAADEGDDKALAGTGENPAGTGENLPGTEENLAETGDNPAGTGENPAGTGENLAETEENPAGPEENLAGVEDDLAGVEENSAETDEDQAGAGEDLAGAGKDPVDADEVLAGAGKDLAGAGEGLAGVGEDLAGAGERTAGNESADHAGADQVGAGRPADDRPAVGDHVEAAQLKSDEDPQQAPERAKPGPPKDEPSTTVEGDHPSVIEQAGGAGRSGVHQIPPAPPDTDQPANDQQANASKSSAATTPAWPNQQEETEDTPVDLFRPVEQQRQTSQYGRPEADPAWPTDAPSGDSTVNLAKPDVEPTTDRTQPETDRTPPTADRTPSKADRTSLAADGPTGDSTVNLATPGVESPKTDRTPPTTDSSPPAADQTPPATDRTPPAADRTPSAADRTPPAANRTPHAADRTPPATDRTPPAADRTSSTTTPTPPKTDRPPIRPNTSAADPATVFFPRPAQPPKERDDPPSFVRPSQADSTTFIPRIPQPTRPPQPERQPDWPPPEPPRAAPQRVGPPPKEPPTPRKKKPLLKAGIAVVAVLALAAGVVFGIPGVAQKLGLTGGGAAAIAPPPGPVTFTPGLRGPDSDAPKPTRTGVESALAGPIASPALGSVTGMVIDPSTGETLYERNGGAAITPASTGKILTAAAALLSLDHTEQLVTKVVQGEQPGEVIIVGGGDPTISSLPDGEETIYPGAAHLDDLVEQVRNSGTQVTTVYIDESRYSDQRMAPSWDPADIGAGYIAPIVPAMLDGDRQREPAENYSPRSTDPGRTLVGAFASRIGAEPASSIDKKAPEGAKVLGEIRSAPIAQLVDNMLDRSENTLGDILAHEVAIKKGEEPSFDGASKAMLDVLRENGFDVDGVVLRDGSGMSKENEVSANLLAKVLAVAAGPDGKDPRTNKLRPLLGGLPVAGGSGTLADRYTQGAAVAGKGWVRAKTGTLTGVNSLAGIVLDKDNRPLVFAFLSTGTTGLAPRAALDTVAAALRGCGCQ